MRLLLALGLPLVHAGEAPLSLLDHEAHPLAVCLDGSPGAYYYSAATAAANSSKWVILLQGGGECVTAATCQQRANTSLGSSVHLPPTHAMEGIQSTKLAHNRDFSTWNMLFVPYCSGDLHLGQQTASNPDGVTFAGHHIITGVLRTAAATLGLANSSVVVFTGESAGGIGCVAHSDYVADFVSNATRGRGLTVAAPIGGFYFSNDSPYNASSPPPVSLIPWTFDALRLYHTYWDAFVPAACAARHPGAAHTCMFAQVSYAAIATPMFVIEAQTDKVVMPLHDGLPPLWDTWPYRCDNKVEGCPAAVLAYMGSWRDQMGAAVAQVGRTRKAALGNRTDGLFHPACLIHTSFKLAKPLIGGRNYLDALGAWLFGTGPVRYVDSCKGVMCGAC